MDSAADKKLTVAESRYKIVDSAADTEIFLLKNKGGRNNCLIVKVVYSVGVAFFSGPITKTNLPPLTISLWRI